MFKVIRFEIGKPYISLNGEVAMKKPRLVKKFDRAQCDRFAKVWKMSGLDRWSFAKSCGLGNTSQIVEIKNYVLEPSKRIVLKLYENMGINPNYILIGIGKMRLPAEEQLKK